MAILNADRPPRPLTPRVKAVMLAMDWPTFERISRRGELALPRLAHEVAAGNISKSLAAWLVIENDVSYAIGEAMMCVQGDLRAKGVKVDVFGDLCRKTYERLQAAEAGAKPKARTE